MRGRNSCGLLSDLYLLDRGVAIQPFLVESTVVLNPRVIGIHVFEHNMGFKVEHVVNDGHFGLIVSEIVPQRLFDIELSIVLELFGVEKDISAILVVLIEIRDVGFEELVEDPLGMDPFVIVLLPELLDDVC